MKYARDGAIAVVSLDRPERRNAVDLATARALVARLVASGVKVTHDPLPFEGKPHAYLEDPFGNRIEVIAT